MTGSKWPALPARANTSHASPALTKTAASDPATPAAGGSGKRNSNQAQPTDGQTVSPSPPVDPGSDFMSVAIIGGSDSDSDYVDSDKKSPTISANALDLAGHISKLEAMHNVLEGDLATDGNFLPYQRARNSGARQYRYQPAGKPPRQWRHAAGQHPSFPAVLASRRNRSRLSQASTTPTHQGQRPRPSSVIGRPPVRPPPRRRLHNLWSLPALGAPKFRRPFGWSNRGRQ